MNWTVYFVAACGGLAIGTIIGWVLTELRYYNRYNRLKDKAEADLDEIKRAVSANILMMAAVAKQKMTEAVSGMGDKPEMAAIRDSFAKQLDEAFAKAGGNPITLARVAKEAMPPMLISIGHIRSAQEESRRLKETYDRLTDTLKAVGAEFWKLVRAVVGQRVSPEELTAVGERLAAAHRAFDEDGLAAGLTRLSEVMAEISRLADKHLPSQPDHPKEAN